MVTLAPESEGARDLIPTLVAYQIEWNKVRLRLRNADWPQAGEAPDPVECATVLGGTEDDWLQLSEAWGEEYVARLPARASEAVLGGTAARFYGI